MAKNGVSQEYIGPPKLEKIQMYILTRAELLYPLCNEMPFRIDVEPPSGSFQMVTLHSTPRVIELGHTNESDTGISQLPCQFSLF